MVTQIDLISTPPTPADPPAEFERKAAQVWSDLAHNVPQMNAQATELEAIGANATQAAGEAAVDSDLALGYKNEANQSRTAAQTAKSQAETARGEAVAAKVGAEAARDAAAQSAADSENRVPMTGETGAALLPKGTDAQRPNPSTHASSLILRGSTVDGCPEWYDPLASRWRGVSTKPMNSGDDLNNYTVDGEFYVGTTAAAQSIVNKPVEVTSVFGLQVINTGGASALNNPRRKQILTVNSATSSIVLRVYTRWSSSGSWSPWVLEASTPDVRALEQSIGFTIIYPNGGTEAAPANITNNQRLVSANPFSGKSVICEVQILIGGVWGDPGWADNAAAEVFGVRAGQLNETGDIVVQSGVRSVAGTSNISGGLHGYTGTLATAPVRVKVWKAG